MDTAAPASEQARDRPGAGRLDARRVLAVDELACVRAGRTVFDELAFDLGPGGVLQVEGPNGSGKTTLLRAICGLVPVERGEIRWCGEPLEPGDERFLAELRYVGHVAGNKDDLTAHENLATAAALAGGGGETPEAALAHVQLAWARDVAVRRLSAGQRRRVALARLLVAPAPLWILDEPLAALDARSRGVLEELIVEHARDDGLTLISTHQPLSLGDTAVGYLHLDETPA